MNTAPPKPPSIINTKISVLQPFTCLDCNLVSTLFPGSLFVDRKRRDPAGNEVDLVLGSPVVELVLLVAILPATVGTDVSADLVVSAIDGIAVGTLVVVGAFVLVVVVLFPGTTKHALRTGTNLYPGMQASAHLLFCITVHCCSTILNPHWLQGLQ